jgi:hypothetical protein
LPAALFEREGTHSLIVFDEIQDVLAVTCADGKLRAMRDGDKPRLTDPMFEHWLQTRGLTPAAGGDEELD